MVCAGTKRIIARRSGVNVVACLRNRKDCAACINAVTARVQFPVLVLSSNSSSNVNASFVVVEASIEMALTQNQSIIPFVNIRF